MNSLLTNPVFNALSTTDARFSLGNERVKFFDEEQSPFAGFEEGNEKGFEELYELLPRGRKILFAIPGLIATKKGWKIFAEIKGLQFIFRGSPAKPDPSIALTILNESHVSEMIDLAKLTKPGPFGKRTIDFGHYYGVIENEKLVAMTGQRLHIHDLSEISAVCTHPDYLGKGYAAALLNHQLNLIESHGEKAFLHVREDNARAIQIYERLGFVQSRIMNFYFMRRT